jgi:3-oxoacyl-[acyl-carrier protein] reductase
VSSAVVTGGGRGIGRAIALALAERGLELALLARTVEQLERTSAEIATRGGRAIALRCDVGNAGEVAGAADRLSQELSPVHVVVHCAGVVRRAFAKDMTEQDWDSVLDTNLKGTFLVTRALLPGMLARRAGRVIAISSISGTVGTPRLTAYCASKWGVIGMVKALAEELRGTGVQAMCVVPGSVDTLMLTGSGFEPQMTPEDVARVVVFAALDAPLAMNGSAMEIFGP